MLPANPCISLSFLGHDAIVTLLKHYKRPQDESPCNEYSQPGGGMGWAIILFKGPDPRTAEISGSAPPVSESFGSVLSSTNKITVMGLSISCPYSGSSQGCSSPVCCAWCSEENELCPSPSQLPSHVLLCLSAFSPCIINSFWHHWLINWSAPSLVLSLNSIISLCSLFQTVPTCQCHPP